jgi:hypothetical protein|tara:strand:+ start:359 stop:508 length:150 start_codon:yes stop_codon:yes gene_type:complete
MINWREILVIILSNIAIGTILIAITIIVQRNSCDKQDEDFIKVTKQAKH